MIEPTEADKGRTVAVSRANGPALAGPLVAYNGSYVVVRLAGHDTPVPRGACAWAGARPAAPASPRAVAARSVFAAAGLAIAVESELVWRVEGYVYQVEGGSWTAPDGRAAGLNASDLVKHWRAATKPATGSTDA